MLVEAYTRGVLYSMAEKKQREEKLGLGAPVIF